MIAQKMHEKRTLIIDTIKMLQSQPWYGCSNIIEIAKGKNALPRNWKETKEKIRRGWYMDATKIEEDKEQKTNTILSWLTRRKLR